VLAALRLERLLRDEATLRERPDDAIAEGGLGRRLKAQERHTCEHEALDEFRMLRRKSHGDATAEGVGDDDGRPELAQGLDEVIRIMLAAPGIRGFRGDAETGKVDRKGVQARDDGAEIGTRAAPPMEGDDLYGGAARLLGEEPPIRQRRDHLATVHRGCGPDRWLLRRPALRTERPGGVLLEGHLVALPGVERRFDDAPALDGRVIANEQERIAREDTLEHLPVGSKFRLGKLGPQHRAVEREDVARTV